MHQANLALRRIASLAVYLSGLSMLGLGIEAPIQAQETPAIAAPTLPSVNPQQLLPAAVTTPVDVNITPDLPAVPLVQPPNVPTPEVPTVEPGESQLAEPSFQASPFNAPQFNAPQFVNPILTTPTLAAPAFTAPMFTGLQTGGAQFAAPAFTAPTFASPTLNAPTLTAPTLTFIQAPPEAAVQPVTVPAAQIPVPTVDLGN